MRLLLPFKSSCEFGFECNVMVDAPGWSQGASPMASNTPKVLAVSADPFSNVIFSDHIYGFIGKDIETLSGRMLQIMVKFFSILNTVFKIQNTSKLGNMVKVNENVIFNTNPDDTTVEIVDEASKGFVLNYDKTMKKYEIDVSDPDGDSDLENDQNVNIEIETNK
ncbi:hypothetical protein PIROE2DRAFT_64956 [Piromyces sp. E2]|nr:hypothetical protein PIROE2DRAFT_64956 [Piromyces sp. E2]|eukprot:OUM57532.1 hypothetical protein PIROE2DRAFT_64956 [Piromyces sp. E2]